jgi:hypothetical protein
LFIEYLIQCHAMGIIEIVFWCFMLAQIQHFFELTTAHFVGKLPPVFFNATVCASGTQCGRKARVPVENRASSVKSKGFNIR